MAKSSKGTTNLTDREKYIQQYVKSRSSGADAAEATQAARASVMPDFDDVVSSHSSQSAAAQAIASGSAVRDSTTGRVNYTSPAESYAQRVKATTALNDWASKIAASSAAKNTALNSLSHDEAYEQQKAKASGLGSYDYFKSILNAGKTSLWDRIRNGTNGTMSAQIMKAGQQAADKEKNAENRMSLQYATAHKWDDDIKAASVDPYTASVGQKLYNDRLIALHNEPGTAGIVTGQTDHIMGVAWGGQGQNDMMRYMIQDGWSEDQKHTFYYLYANDKEKANEYAYDINSAIANMQTETELQKYENGDFGVGDYLKSNAAKMITAPAQMIARGASAAVTGQAGIQQGATYNQQANAMAEYISRVLNDRFGTLNDDIPVIGGKGLGDVFQLGQSIVDSAASRALGPMGMASFFGTAGESAYDDAKKRGANDAQAVAYGMANGINEALFEWLSWDKILDTSGRVKSKKDLLKMLGKSFFIEGSEEINTSIANLVADALIMQENSENNRRIRELMQADYSYEEAAGAVFKSTLEGLLYDGLTGGISGALHGGAARMVNTVGNRITNKGNTESQGNNNPGEEAYVRAIADYQTQQAEQQAADSKKQATVDTYTKRLSTSDYDTGMTANTEGARLTYNGRTATASGVVRDSESNTNKLKLTYDDGTQENIKLSDAMETDLDVSVKNLITLLSGLGADAPAAYNLYEQGQQAGTYAAAMDQAINLYAANGADVKKVAANDKNSLVSYLTQPQLTYAAAAGSRIMQERKDSASEYSAKINATKAEINAGIESMQSLETELTGQKTIANTLIDNFTDTLNELESLQAAGVSENSPEFQNLYARAADLQANIEAIRENVGKLEERKKELNDRKPVKRKKGTVSFEGGRVNGKNYKGVDRSTLSRQQKNVVAMVETLADIVNIDYVFFEADPKGVQGVYTKGGKIFLNINAGQAVNKTLVASTLSHELTHFLEKNSPEEYEQLRDFVVTTLLEEDQAGFERMVKRRMELEPGLSYDGAVREVVANACETMLMNSQAVTQLARENMTLAEKIADFIADFAEKLKAAFEDLTGPYLRESRAMANHLDEMQELWDKALYAAVQNYNTMQSEKNNTADNGGVQYSKADQEEILHLKEQIRSSEKQLNAMEPVAVIKSEIKFDLHDIQTAVKWARKKLGIPETKPAYVEFKRKGFGTAKFERKRINKAFNYLPKASNEHLRTEIGQAYTTAFAALREVFEDGIQIQEHKNHKEYGIDTWTFAAPVVIDGKRGNIAIVIRKTTDVYYDVHRVLTPDGDLMVLDRNEKAEALTGGVSEYESVAPAMLPATDNIADSQTERNSQNQTWDEETYERAVNSGDMDTAQRMVDQAAKDAGYTVKAYHGTPNGTFTTFKDWQYFTLEKWYADIYQEQGASSNGYKQTADNPKTYEVYLKPGKAFDTRKARDRRIFMNEFYRQWGNGAPLSERSLPDWTDGDDFIEFFEDNGYDYDAIYLDEGGTGGYGDEVIDRGISIVIKDSSQIKSADPVTYDNNGNIIPLSERFKSEESDIRYQMWSSEELESMSYADIAVKRAEINQQIRELERQKKESQKTDSFMNIFDEREKADSLVLILNRKKRRSGGTLTIEDQQALDSAKARRAELSEELEKLNAELGDFNGKINKLKAENERLRAAEDAAYEREGTAKELAAIAKKGVDPVTYFQDKAVKNFGTTTDFKEAGYLLTNGKMLNFSGEKGKHTGHRSEDHRSIGFIYETTQGTAALNRFMADGNIRIIAESPGMDMPTDHEPTREQYLQIKKYIQNVGAVRGEFYIDFSDKNGHNVGNYSYDGNIKADKILDDIKYFYANGQVRENSLSQFLQYQQWDDQSATDDTSAESNGRSEAYTSLQAQNTVLQETITELKKALQSSGKDNKKLSKNIAELQKQLKLTKTPEVREADAKRMAREIIKDHSSKANSTEIAQMIKALGDYIVQNNGADLDYDEMIGRARAIAENVVTQARDIINEDDGRLAVLQDAVSTMKGMKLTLAEQDRGELDVAGGYETFRKKNFNRFTLGEGYTEVDSAYKELQGTYGYTIYPEVNNPGEALLVMSEVFEDAKPVYGNPYEKYMGETIEALAQDIAFDALGDTLRQAEPTFADKQKNRYDALKAEHEDALKMLDAAVRENFKKDNEAFELEEQNEELKAQREEALKNLKSAENALFKAQQKIETLKEQKKARVSEVYRQGTARAAEARAKERAAKWEKVGAVRDYYRDMIDRAGKKRKESESASRYRRQIAKKAGKLYDYLMENTGKHHVPEALKLPVAEFLSQLDFSSKKSLSGNGETRADRAFADSLRDLRDVLSRQRNAQENLSGNEVFDGYLDLPEGILESMDELVRVAAVVSKAGGTYTINRMTSEQLKAVSDMLSVLNQAVTQMNSFIENGRYQGVDEAGAETISEMEELPEYGEQLRRGGKHEIIGKAGDFLQWDNTVPVYAFKRYGKAGQAMFDELIKGWGDFAKNAKEAKDFAEKTFTEKESKDWAKDKRTLTLLNEKGEEETVKMSVWEIMSLYTLAHRQQALQHIQGGGIQAPSFSVNHYAVDAETIMNLGSLLTGRQLEVAKALQQFMQNTGGEWGNNVTMKRWGIKMFGEENYFPIETDSSDRNADGSVDVNVQRSTSLYRIMNMGFTKALNKRANNALVIRPMNEVFANHMADMAKYNGLTLPMLDMMKWYNYREIQDIEETGSFSTKTVQRSINRAYGDGATGYFINFMKDMNGSHEGGRGEGMFKAIMSNYKVAQIGNNPRVVIQQPTSIARAAVRIKPKFLLNGIAKATADRVTRNKKRYNEMMSNSGIAVWKIDLGFYDVNINAGMREQIMRSKSLRGKLQDMSTARAGKADERTWTAMWNACRADVESSTDLEGEELMKAVTYRFEHLMLETQVMDSTISRSQMMRSTNVFMSEITGFKSEPTLSYNVVADAYNDLRADWKKHGWGYAWRKNKGNISKTMLVYLFTAGLTSAAAAVIDAARDDDEYETFLQKWLQHTGENFIDNANPLSLIPVVADAYELMYNKITGKGYTSDSMVTAGINKMLTFLSDAYKVLTDTYDGKKTPLGLVYEGAQAFGMLSGLAFAPILRGFTSLHNGFVTIYNDVVGRSSGEMLEYWSTYKEEPLTQLKRAYEAGYVNAEEAKAEMLNMGMDEEKAGKEIFKWNEKSSSAYGSIKKALEKADVSEAMRLREEMLASGFNEADFNSEIRKAVKELYTDSNERISQANAVDMLMNVTGMSRADAEAKTSWWIAQRDHPEIDADSNGSISQDEIGAWLQAQIRSGNMSQAEVESTWRGVTAGNAKPWKNTFKEWQSKKK